MHEIDKTRVKSESLLKVEYKIEKDICELVVHNIHESKPLVHDLKQESCSVYKDENKEIEAERIHINEYLELEDDTAHIKIKTIKMEQSESVTEQKELDLHESKPWPNDFDMCYNAETVIVEEVQIKDEINTNKSHGYLESVNSNSSYLCNICQYKTEIKSRFRKHIKTHIGEKSFICNVCYFKTTTKDYLQDHKKIHEGNRKYSKCSYCDYKSTKKSNLNRHMEICKMKRDEHSVSLKKRNPNLHLNNSNDAEKHFKCDQCDYSSSFKCSLGNHRKIHLERILRCDHCNYTTLKQHELSLHVMVHDGRQPYECGICGYKAAFKKNLQRHILKHAEIKPFKCDECTYTTYRKHHLTSHMLVHTRKKKSVKSFSMN
ncbi:hypothetical protein ILUMI_26020 [Ignelater luminosus]|uniref:C2H2-type domain-containing protein n=1 Tax=Ignelater luminosus TaxID=2038154 RepID=A0A8K0C7A4_IGNLU|nr:hypothetical protein ILUMI_26020 [Ignelater luminosus]